MSCPKVEVLTITTAFSVYLQPPRPSRRIIQTTVTGDYNYLSFRMDIASVAPILQYNDSPFLSFSTYVSYVNVQRFYGGVPVPTKTTHYMPTTKQTPQRYTRRQPSFAIALSLPPSPLQNKNCITPKPKKTNTTCGDDCDPSTSSHWYRKI